MVWRWNIFLTRNAVLHAQDPVSQLWIGPHIISRKLPRSLSQICLYLLTIQIRIAPPHDPPLHQKRRAARHKRRGKGSPCKLPISASRDWSGHTHARCSQIGFWHTAALIDRNRTSPGKIRIGKSQGVIRRGSNDTGRRGRDRQCKRAPGRKESRSLIQGALSRQPHLPGTVHDPPREKRDPPDSAVHIGPAGKKGNVDFLFHTVRFRFSVIDQQLGLSQIEALSPGRVAERACGDTRRVQGRDIDLICVGFPELNAQGRLPGLDRKLDFLRPVTSSLPDACPAVFPSLPLPTQITFFHVSAAAFKKRSTREVPSCVHYN